MNAVTITAAGLRAALAGLRDRAADPGREQPADYLTGGIDLLVALLPEEDAAARAPVTPVSLAEQVRAAFEAGVAGDTPSANDLRDAVRFVDDHEACRMCGVVYHHTCIQSCNSGEPICDRCRPELIAETAAAEAQFQAACAAAAAPAAVEAPAPAFAPERWALPTGDLAYATLDQLLPDAALLTPYQVHDIIAPAVRWALLIPVCDDIEDEGITLSGEAEWRTFATEADARGFATGLHLAPPDADAHVEAPSNPLPSADTTAEPTASLASAPAEEAPPTPESAAPSPPPSAATAEGATPVAAEPDNAPPVTPPAAELLPKSLADAAARSAPAASSSATDERLSLLRTLWVDPSCSVSEIFRRWNALPGKPLVTSNALYGHAKKLGLSTQRPVTMPTRSTDAPAVAPPQAEPRMKQAWRKPETPLPAPNAAEASRSFDPKSLDPEDNGLKESREVTTARGLLGEGYDESYVARLSRLSIDQVRKIAASLKAATEAAQASPPFAAAAGGEDTAA
ncbi:hypothetical protein GXW78_07690 [Roseomonas terrae]|uniref:Uncharacterized protein n=1 Tax=Neoroseomonas terrae TaxID=424799 RepID=A0ABS5EEU8_9PROT|nr:hypothetical protein [Neoroseomonas terrae]MBR0649537.1 hypothetical protein [Neoroseomonas terrae]